MLLILKCECQIIQYSIQCRPGWIRGDKFCYNFSADRCEFQGAADKCRAYGSDLLMLKSEEEHNNFISFVSNNSLYPHILWLGMTRYAGGSNFKWQDGSAVNYTNWRSGYPRDDENCVYMKDYGELRSVYCDKNRYYVCQVLPTEYECPDGWNRSFSQDICYKSLGLGTHHQAQNVCSTLSDARAEVLMPKTEEENAYLGTWMAENNIKNVITGLSRTTLLSTIFWVWYDGEPLAWFDYTNWYPGTYPLFAPYDSCVIITETGNYKWEHSVTFCGGTWDIVCQCRLPSLINVGTINQIYCLTPTESTTEGITTESITTRDITTAKATTENDAPTSNIPNYTVSNAMTSTLHATVDSDAPTSNIPNHTVSDATTSTSPATVDDSIWTSYGPYTSQQSTSASECYKECQCSVEARPLTSKQLEEKIQNIKTNLTLETSTLSKTIRRMTCADDPRPSSKYIGFVGGGIMLLVLGILILIDTMTLVRYLFP